LRSTALGGAAVLAAAAALASPLMTTAATAGSIQTGGHSIQTADMETHLSIDAGKTVTESISCADGYFATSGGFLADSVDDGDVSSVFVTTSKLASLATWTVTIRNDNDVRAQGKLKASCVSLNTAAVQDKHPHGFTATDAVNYGSRDTPVLKCAAGQIPYALGYEADAPVVITKSWSDVKSATATIIAEPVDDTARVNYSARCLNPALDRALPKDAPAVVATDVTEPFSAGEGITEGNVACPSNTISLTPSYSFEADTSLAFLGSDPRGTQWMFRFANPFDEATATTLGVTCIGAAPVAADPVQKITIEEIAAKDKDKKTVAVTVSCVFKCAVTVKLYGRWAGSQVIAVGKATIGADGRKAVTLKAKSAFWKDWIAKNSVGTVKAVAGSKRATQDIKF
jgi:hypothetical protein